MLCSFRKKSLFVFTALTLALTFSILSILTKEAAAYMMSSKLSSEAGQNLRQKDLNALKSFLEKKVVLQKLQDFGMSKEEALSKISQLDDQDIHALASIVDTSPAGGDALGFAIGLAVLAILVIIILKLLNKEIIIK